MYKLYPIYFFLVSLILFQGLWAEQPVVEEAKGIRPVINITGPVHQYTFEVGYRIFIEASAKDADGSIAEVIFTINGQQIGEADTVFPYQSILYEIQNPGIFQISAVAIDDAGNSSAPDIVVIYGVPLSDNKPEVFDPINSEQDFLIQVFMDLLYRDPTDSELNRYLEELEFGTMTKAQVVESLFETAEFQNLLHSQNAYKTIIGEWPSPKEFSSILPGIEEVGESEPVDMNDDVGNSFESAQVLSPGNRTFTGVLGDYADADVFTFQIFRETVVNLSTTGPFDTTGSLYDADGNLLESDDDSGPFFNFSIEKWLMPGSYYLSVAGWAGTLGTYSLTLNFGGEIQLPKDQSIPDSDLNQTIFSLYNSQAYYDRYGLVPDLSISERDRRNLFRQLYENRFGEDPTLQQLQQGASRILLADTIESFTSAFIRDDRAGVESYINNVPDVNSRNAAAFLIRSLLKTRPNRKKIDSLAGSSFHEQVDALLGDPVYHERFQKKEKVDVPVSEKISIPGDDSGINFEPSNINFINDPEFLRETGNPFETIDQSANGWKYLDWFGWFSDLEYPWLYHEKMGWVEIKPINSEEMWLWHNRFEWSYTGAQSFPYLYRYLDERWIRLDFMDQPDEFQIIEPTSEPID